ncbi:MAG: hypothetical protein IJN50_02105 [Clostridia bacterium]|nr:hypothetical protein [Clostridia bacterium]
MSKSINFEMNICSKCNGKCCREGLYVTKKEYELLEDKYKEIFQCEKFMNGYRAIGEKCSFLSNDGCIIPQDKRFIECKLFPLEIAALDKLIINEEAKQKCIGLDGFTTKEYYTKGYKLLEHYVKEGLLTKEDVESILNNEYNL